jgi:imidazolonepropionase-like amidohydrolase
MSKLGLPPIEAIRAATASAADLMGWRDKVGSIEVGNYADVIALSGESPRRHHRTRARQVRHERRNSGKERHFHPLICAVAAQ